MGNLKPDATYIYEKSEGVTYAREFCEPSTTRVPIGWDADVSDIRSRMQEDKLWGEIRRAAVSNPLLQEALNRVKIIYQLSKSDGKE